MFQYECPLCYPGQKCATCSFHDKWVGRMFERKHFAARWKFDDWLEQREEALHQRRVAINKMIELGEEVRGAQ